MSQKTMRTTHDSSVASSRLTESERLFGITDEGELNEVLWRFKAVIDILAKWDSEGSRTAVADPEGK